jgi:hypothetical protein
VSVIVGGGMCVGVFVGIKIEVKVGRARLVRLGVTVTKCLGVEVEVSDGKGLGKSASVGTSV